MVWHDDVSVYLKAFVVLAKPPTVQKDVPINLAGKEVDPSGHGTNEVIESMLVPDFVFDAHGVWVWFKVVECFGRG